VIGETGECGDRVPDVRPSDDIGIN
jgi:hypothetical protein